MAAGEGKDGLLVGTSQVDITPPVGTALAGSLRPRDSDGVQDPLYAKAIVLESQGVKLAYVGLDLIALAREHGDRAVAQASECTGIPEESIVWSATHTHTGPYTAALYSNEHETINREWLDSLPENFAQCVRDADASKVSARFSRTTGCQTGVSHNRRVRLKDGRHINTWNLAGKTEHVQCVGSAGPIDPEIGILGFEDVAGRLLAVLFNFALHTNTNFGSLFSADYPGVVAARIRERFGPQVTTLFAAGACGDINTANRTYRQVGDLLSQDIVGELERRTPVGGGVRLGVVKREVTVPRRDFVADQEARIRNSGWRPEDQEIFRRELEIMRQQGRTQDKSILQAWRIGDVGFASLPGELFVEWGLKIKQQSPFPWTYPVELGGDYLGYLVTEQAWEGGGYESLIARTAMPAPGGVADMVDTALEMLKELHGAC